MSALGQDAIVRMTGVGGGENSKPSVFRLNHQLPARFVAV